AGMTANAIQNVLKGTPLAIRRSSLLEVIREIKGAELTANRIKSVRPELRISERLFTPTKMTYKSMYRVTALVTYKDPVTGIEDTFSVRRGFDTLPTRKELEENLVDMMKGKARYDETTRLREAGLPEEEVASLAAEFESVLSRSNIVDITYLALERREE
ncbi:MAG: hypothetical protein QXQ02_09695, partial [Halobacteria archaeon]